MALPGHDERKPMTADAPPVAQTKLVIADVDGTLVTSEKALTPRAVQAVAGLREAGIAFAVTSGRPPRGMTMLVEPLRLDTAISGFNGGLTVEPDGELSVLQELDLPGDVVGPVLELLERSGLDTWLYRANDWYIRARDAPHVEREAWTVKFEPEVVESYEGMHDRVVKIVGVSDDHDAVRTTSEAAREQFGDRLSAAASQPYYLDVTHPHANKASVVRYLSQHLGVPPESIATIGDMPNDVLMFAHSGLSIAMGNADDGVKRCARRVTLSNEEDGFAVAMERFVLGRPGAAP
jgi:Cof subfamily protein (haloacid dehalogenase superfamily)